MIALNTSDPRVSYRMGTEPELRFVETVCRPLLQGAQNRDGGWGFHPGSKSSIEATCWALQALVGLSWPEIPERAAEGFAFLRRTQLPDGSWPSVPGNAAGCWVTSLACWALLSAKDSCKAVARGLQSLCADWPGDSTPWRRFLLRFSSQRHVAPINISHRGWPWTSGTSSWVEPTAYALLALGECPPSLLPGSAPKRRRLGEAMLYDRMCAGGGWNTGNPLVYGAAGEAFVVPTAFSLLALRHCSERSENVLSLHWLESNVPEIRGLGSLALARLCLDAYGREWPKTAPDFPSLHQESELMQNIQVLAWCSLALGGKQPFSTAGAPVRKTP